MAINIERQSAKQKEKAQEAESEKIIITLDNGHIEALDKIVNDYSLKGTEQAVSFMLGLISEADGTSIEVKNNKYLPPDSFKKTP